MNQLYLLLFFFFQQKINFGPASFHAVEGLKPDTLYSFQLAASSAMGLGVYTSVIQARTAQSSKYLCMVLGGGGGMGGVCLESASVSAVCVILHMGAVCGWVRTGGTHGVSVRSRMLFRQAPPPAPAVFFAFPYIMRSERSEDGPHSPHTFIFIINPKVHLYDLCMPAIVSL